MQSRWDLADELETEEDGQDEDGDASDQCSDSEAQLTTPASLDWFSWMTPPMQIRTPPIPAT